MSTTFTLQEFYNDYFDGDAAKKFVVLPQIGHFNVFERGTFCKKRTQIQRADFYKIALVMGTGIFHLEDKKIEVTGKALIFYNPALPHLWESVSEKQEGFFCLFNSQFVTATLAD